MLAALKHSIKARPALFEPIRRHRARVLEGRYLRLRDHYARTAESDGLIYDRQTIHSTVQQRLGDRSLTGRSALGRHVHFLDEPRHTDYNQHQLYGTLRRMGRLTVTDYSGIDVTSADGRRAWNQAVLQQITRLHAEHPVDVVFAYVGTFLLEVETVNRIKALGIPVTSYWADDKQNFLAHMNAHAPGAAPLVGAIDLHWTTVRECALWYQAEGGLAVYMPEGADPAAVYPMADVERDIPVSFFGRRYGARGRIVDEVRRRQVDIRGFGSGWQAGAIGWDEIARALARSRINLGIGGIANSDWLSCLKGRDFEVPLARGLYLTTYDPELAQFFDIGREILCYKHVEEAVELIRYYLRHEDEAEAIREAGYRRALAEHTWEHRLIELWRMLGAA